MRKESISINQLRKISSKRYSSNQEDITTIRLNQIKSIITLNLSLKSLGISPINSQKLLRNSSNDILFSALPVVVENVSKKILEHITEQCLVCCDVGVPCNARKACDDPSSLIFSFQEGEVERCRSCKVVFHKLCFKKIATCPCGAQIKLDETKRLESRGSMNSGRDANGTLDLLGRQEDSWSSANFLSGLFSKAKLEKLVVRKGHDNVISMGSLPSSSL